MDRITIRDLSVWCIIGTRPHEREEKQPVQIQVVLECDLRAAGESDRIEDTVNYKDLKNRIVERVEASEYFLIEKLAAVVAGLCLEDRRVAAAEVTVDKPGALTRARSVAVHIRRERAA